jgi:hypothetical protein
MQSARPSYAQRSKGVKPIVNGCPI